MDERTVQSTRAAAWLLSVVLLWAAVSGTLTWAGDQAIRIAEGTKVTLDYTLALPDKTVIETTVGKEPVSYVQGRREILPGLEKALAGLKAGDKKHVTVSADDGYGRYDEKKKMTVTKDQVPPNVKAGTRLRAQNGMEATVVSVEGNGVVVDLNHPLAGKTLEFDINILKVEQEDKRTK
ncbi:FKBP-type peptidyl-prolyl cis-trans isomerase [Candidatus Nitrospira bockiana]